MPTWYLTSVISGGQTGADQAGISAAKFLNYPTGGMAPKGWRTEDGPAPWLAEFGLRESVSASMRSRTYHNVITSDGTAIFTKEAMDSQAIETAKSKAFGLQVKTPDTILAAYGVEGGSLYTAQLAIAHRKHLIVNPTKPEELRRWIYESKIRVLNIAGSRESKAPGLFTWAYEFLLDALVPF